MASLQLQCSILSLPICKLNVVRNRVTNKRSVVCAVQKIDYRPPSSRTAATELNYLESWSTVVPDTLLLQDIEKIEAPKAATVTSAVLGGILRNPAGLQEYKVRKYASGSRSVRYHKTSKVAPLTYHLGLETLPEMGL